ncbi:hypothetical protein DM02DRAFT_77404 [Periconia macrospinosa]|uniref:Uncharacterized protein n=1 Tax=Periconia macrospinosa TaxID=97972 RepID=A0A2V1DHT2_9PLEO|nr:hypothetical protein DM02DRAFT_77404 [Periconia macrospinosa]
MGDAMQAVRTDTNLKEVDRETKKMEAEQTETKQTEVVQTEVEQTEAAMVGLRSGDGYVDEKQDVEKEKPKRKDSFTTKSGFEVIEGIEVALWSAGEGKSGEGANGNVQRELPQRAATNETNTNETYFHLITTGYTPHNPPPCYTPNPDSDMELAADSPASPSVVSADSQDHQKPCEDEGRKSGKDVMEPKKDSQCDQETDNSDLYVQDIPTPPGYDAKASHEKRLESLKDTPSLYDQVRHERETFKSPFPDSTSEVQKYPACFPCLGVLKGVIMTES